MVAAFAYTRDGYDVAGKMRRVWGTFTSSGGATGGDIVTSLSRVVKFTLTDIAAAVHDGVDVVNETYSSGFPGTVTIVTDADVVGVWSAEGYF